MAYEQDCRRDPLSQWNREIRADSTLTDEQKEHLVTQSWRWGSRFKDLKARYTVLLLLGHYRELTTGDLPPAEKRLLRVAMAGLLKDLELLATRSKGRTMVGRRIPVRRPVPVPGRGEMGEDDAAQAAREV